MVILVAVIFAWFDVGFATIISSSSCGTSCCLSWDFKEKKNYIYSIIRRPEHSAEFSIQCNWPKQICFAKVKPSVGMLSPLRTSFGKLTLLSVDKKFLPSRLLRLKLTETAWNYKLWRSVCFDSELNQAIFNNFVFHQRCNFFLEIVN